MMLTSCRWLCSYGWLCSCDWLCRWGTAVILNHVRSDCTLPIVSWCCDHSLGARSSCGRLKRQFPWLSLKTTYRNFAAHAVIVESTIIAGGSIRWRHGHTLGTRRRRRGRLKMQFPWLSHKATYSDCAAHAVIVESTIVAGGSIRLCHGHTLGTRRRRRGRLKMQFPGKS